MKTKISFFALAFAITTLCAAHARAAWYVGGVLVSNICRADANPAYYWVYPPQNAQPVGTMCTFPDGTPGTVTAN
jgi:hypothetical protein